MIYCEICKKSYFKNAFKCTEDKVCIACVERLAEKYPGKDVWQAAGDELMAKAEAKERKKNFYKKRRKLSQNKRNKRNKKK